MAIKLHLMALGGLARVALPVFPLLGGAKAAAAGSYTPPEGTAAVLVRSGADAALVRHVIGADTAPTSGDVDSIELAANGDEFTFVFADPDADNRITYAPAV